MNDLEGLERKVDELTRAVAAVESRLAAIEARPHAIVSPRSAVAAAGMRGLPGEDEESGEVVTVLALAGRTCLVLGGAYLLRALTDGGTLPRPLGTAVGVVYAVSWLLVAYRQAPQRQKLTAAFYGAATALIAFPILWEATVRFGLLTAPLAVLAMVGITSLGVAVAWTRRLEGLAWIVVVAGLLAAMAFMLALGPVVALGAYLGFLGIVTLWMGYSLDWIWLRWPVAFVLDFTVLVMAASVTGPWQRQGASSVIWLQLSVFGAYLVSIAARTLWRSRDVIPFEVVQTLALLGACFGGAAYVMLATGSGATMLGFGSLLFGLGSYAVAFAFVERRGHWKNFVFYTSLAVVFILAGTALTADSRMQSIAWTGFAVMSAVLGYRSSTLALWPHAAGYLVAAGVSSGLLPGLSDAFLAASDRSWAVLSWPALVVLAGAAAACAAPVPEPSEAWRPYARLPKLVVAVTLLLGAGGFAIAWSLPLLSAQPGNGADPAIVAGVRTVVLAGAALLLAWMGGRGILLEGRWLVYVVLVFAGFKLLVHDLVAGRPATLFVSLAVYGTALILAPKWARQHKRDQHAAAVLSQLSKT